MSSASADEVSALGEALVAESVQALEAESGEALVAQCESASAVGLDRRPLRHTNECKRTTQMLLD